jgi:hypothetical protein
MTDRRPLRIPFPEGKTFAFTIIDDTDCSNSENIRPIYELLRRLGLRTTKTVWPLSGHDAKDPNQPGQTLADPEYLELVRQLQQWGFEITIHNARSYSSTREDILDGLSKFKALIGHSPRIHANHRFNRDDLYWGCARLDSKVLRCLYGALRILNRLPAESDGHRQGSPYFWGDICHENVCYVRGFSFPALNVLKANPTIPYYDPRRPYVRMWFSACEAPNVEAFNRLLQPENQEALEREGGISIVATHLASGFVENGKVNAETERLLTQLASRPGLFIPVSELLDHLLNVFGSRTIPSAERRRMDWLWFASRIGFSRRLLFEHAAHSRLSGLGIP